MNSVTERLNALKNKVEQGKAAKARAEANLETYTKQRNEVIDEIRALGVEPENLETEIAKLEQEIEASLSQAEQLLS